MVIDAKSGVSGAGKSPSARTHFCSVDSDLMAYGVGSHRHFPEIVAGVAAGSGDAPPAAPSSRTSCRCSAASPRRSTCARERLPEAAELRAHYDEFYAGERFVEVCDAPPELKDVAGTNYCRIFATVDERARRIIVISAIDNLMKGAAGQAVQNMNVMCGLPEHEGLV